MRLATTMMLALLALAGCGETSDSGLDALMQVAGARHYPQELQAPEGGPDLVDVTTSNTLVRAGVQAKSFSGLAIKGAEAVALSFSGEQGHWRIPTGNLDTLNQDLVTFSAQLAFSPRVEAGHYEVVARALDGQGRAGPPRALGVDVMASAAPAGSLVISLSWDTQSDLDLHVTIPDGVEIWARNINSYTPPTVGVIDPSQVEAGGVLLYDSNAQCVLDGRRQEDVVWRQPPPSGHYVVRVDAFSLCAEAGANWKAEVRLGGEVLGRAEGSMVESDTRGAHEKGAGLLALEFDIP